MAQRFRRQAFPFTLALTSLWLLFAAGLANAGAGTALKPYRATYSIVRDGMAAELV